MFIDIKVIRRSKLNKNRKKCGKVQKRVKMGKCGKFSLWLLASEVAASRIEIYNKFD